MDLADAGGEGLVEEVRGVDPVVHGRAQPRLGLPLALALVVRVVGGDDAADDGVAHDLNQGARETGREPGLDDFVRLARQYQQLP